MFTRRLPPRFLNGFQFSPYGNKVEFRRAWSDLHLLNPELRTDPRVGYLGHDCQFHYFQVRGEPLSYVVAIAPGLDPVR